MRSTPPLGAGGPEHFWSGGCYFAFAQTTYRVMSAALTLPLTWTIQPELSLGFTVGGVVVQSIRPGNEAITPEPSANAGELKPSPWSEVNR